MGRRLSYTSTCPVRHGDSIPERTTLNNSEKRYHRPRVVTHSYHLYTYINDIQPETRVLVSFRRYIHPPPSKEHHVPCFPSAYNVVLFAPKRQTARPRGGKCHQECRDIYTKGNYSLL